MSWLEYAMNISAARIVFIVLKALSMSGVQLKVSLPNLSNNGANRCAHLGHISQYVLTAPRKLHICMMLHGGSCSQMAEMPSFQGLSPVGVNKYPSQSISWIPQAHLRWLVVKPNASR